MKSDPDDAGHFSPGRSTLQSVLIILMFLSAFCVRLHHIDRPPLDFSAIRQFQNAHIIRGVYYENNTSIPEYRKQIAKLNMERMGLVLEPRILEHASLLGYRIMGGEHLWIPRVLSSLFWTVGGIFLYLIARIFFTQRTAVFSTLFYLFLPYGILASRIIQPDPLMVMMMLFSIHRILKYDGDPSLLNLMAAVIISAVAVVIKPYCIFMIFGVFLSLAVLQRGFWKALFHRNTLFFGFIISVPSVVYYAYQQFSSASFLGAHTSGSFLPHLIIYPTFWMGWLAMIESVVGYLAFFLAVFGLVIIKQKKTKAVLWGLWSGYFIFGLSATYQIHTHNYYHMPFIPIAALSLGPVAALVTDLRNSLISKRIIIITFSIIVLAIIVFGLGVRFLSSRNMLSEYKDKLSTVATFIGIYPEFRNFFRDDFDKDERTAKEIGEHVGHSVNTVFLTPDFGRVLTYYGEFSGLPWPTSTSLYARKVRGERNPDIEKDFTPKYIVLLYHFKFIKYTPDFFIITAFDEYESQKDLKTYLNSNFPILVKSDDYLIFDLRKMSE